MEWSDRYNQIQQPTGEEISDFISSDLWQTLNTYLQDTYHVLPKTVYSKCSMQRGWNVKYQKGGRALCSLYPMQGYFIALVVIGSREMNEAELMMPMSSEYTKDLFARTPAGYGGKWLMIEVRDGDILRDVENLISLRISVSR